MSSPIALSGLGSISTQFDTIFCDIWGVVHNGVRPYPTAVKALEQFRAKGGRVALVSNSPSTSQDLVEDLASIGVSSDAYDCIASSGEATRHWLKTKASGKMFFIGQGYYRSILQGLNLPETQKPQEAGFVLASSLESRFGYEPQDYLPLLDEFRAHNLPFVCANPDHMVEVGEHLQYEPGAIAALYEEMGGGVVYAGKPHPPIYDLARQMLFETCGHRAEKITSLAIGDSMRTDLAGAKAQGMASLLILAGVNRAETSPESLLKTLEEKELLPLGFMPVLSW